MNLLLPQIYEIAIRSMNDKSQEITTVRKIILKIYFALTQYVLPLELINREVFTKWMEVLRLVLEQAIPQEVQVRTGYKLFVPHSGVIKTPHVQLTLNITFSIYF